MNKRIIAAAGLAVFAAIAFAGASTAKQEPLRLRIATEGAFAPWNATNPNGTLTGFEVELARDLCRRMRADCEIVAQDWDGILPGLQQGRHDAVMAGVSITDERAHVVDFSGAYAADPAVFAVRSGSPLASAFPTLERADLSTAAGQRVAATVAQALEGKTVAVQTSTTHARMLEELFPGVAIRFYDKTDHAALDVAAGRVDVLLGARSTVDAIGKAGSAMVVVGPAFIRGALGQGVAVATRKGDALAERFSQAIAQAGQDGTTAALSARWFGADLSVR